ncbi:MAG: peptide chain release factor family protein [Phycisphaerales bacterium]
MHPSFLPDAELLKQCRLTRGRSSGPGGQHRNKVETKVTYAHLPTGIEAHAGERRSAADNARVALFRLRLALAVSARTPVPLGDARSDLWRSRCTPDGKVSCNTSHHDFPALIAEALDMLHACGADTSKAALRLMCTPSQFIKLLARHPPALILANRWRAERGLHTLAP